MPAATDADPRAMVRPSTEGGTLTIAIAGRLDGQTVPEAWATAVGAVRTEKDWRRLVVDARDLEFCDGAGMGLLLELKRQLHGTGREFEIRGLSPELRELFDMYPAARFATPSERADRRPVIDEIGRATVALVHDLRAIVTFIGELTVETGRALLNPRRLRWNDTFVVIETAGVNAVPIVALLGFLFGFITAFQSAIPLRQFGAELFVADLVAVSLLRELGPLLTAIILAGRSGSAFAAELGTMAVNEEINALRTMGLSPVRFLAVPRVLGAVFVAPLLAIIASLCGLVGGALVVMMLGFPLVTYVQQVTGSVNWIDLLGGLFKAGVFAMLVAAIGCMRGLDTGRGASAVGMSTTRAVVAGLVLIISTDGVFAVLYYALGI